MKRKTNTIKRKTSTRRKQNKNPLSKLFATRRSKMITVVVAFALVGGAFTFFISAQTRYFNPARETSRQAIAAFMYRAEGSPNVSNSQCGNNKPGPFKDVNGNHKFCKEIEWMAKEKISTGYDDGNFRPAAPVSRQAAAAFMYRAAGSPTGQEQNQVCGSGRPGPFSDISGTHQFCKEIHYLKATKATEGYNDGTFRPTATITRQATATFLHRIAGSPNPTRSAAVFTDVSKNNQFYDAIQWLGEQEFSEGFEQQLPNKIADDPAPAPVPTTKPETSSNDTSTGDAPTDSEEAADEDTPVNARYFNPGREISRQAMVVFVHKAQGEPSADNDLCANGESPVNDVPAGSPFCDAINWAVSTEVSTPFAGDNYKPVVAVSRQAAAVFLYRTGGSDAESFNSDNCGEDSDGPFSDVSGTHQFCLEIDYAREKGYIQGYEDGTFKPRDSVTRQAAAAFLHRQAGEPAPSSTEQAFADVPSSHPFFTPIQWMGSEGISAGDSQALPQKIDILSGHELGLGVDRPDLVVNLQTRLQKIGFAGFIDVSGKYDEKTEYVVKVWQGEQGFDQTGIFNANKHLDKLQENEKPVSEGGWRFDSAKLVAYLEAVRASKIENDSLYGHTLCLNAGQGSTEGAQPIVKDLQKRLSIIGYKVSINGIYNNATRDAVNFWRLERHKDKVSQQPGCFVAERMLEELRRDERAGWKVDLKKLEAALNFASAAHAAEIEREKQQAATASAAANSNRDPLDVQGLLLCPGAGGQGRSGYGEVLNLQSRFNRLGMRPHLAGNGQVDARTAAAIAIYKRVNGIDGQDPNCWNATDYQNLVIQEAEGWSFGPSLAAIVAISTPAPQQPGTPTNQCLPFDNVGRAMVNRNTWTTRGQCELHLRNLGVTSYGQWGNERIHVKRARCQIGYSPGTGRPFEYRLVANGEPIWECRARTEQTFGQGGHSFSGRPGRILWDGRIIWTR